ncbi:MAG: gamma-glutamyl-gamma-aminobutyrate hydrolase family protein [Firmicutes bacterium]|nr:gamma-glutamyl-gamma-aminobutyrate hydrolase family protein [Bacillota bacterium]
MRPLIGITVHTRARRAEALAFELGAACARAVYEAGGLPVVLPVLTDAADDLVDRLRGIVLTGGGRLPPGFSPQDPRPSLESINPARYAFERALIGAALLRGLPLLGICRGMQMLTEALGGRLVRNIALDWPGALPHYQRGPGWQTAHDVEIAADARLAAILGTTRVPVNSFHRQAVETPGTGLRVVARAPDGIVEAVEGRGSAFIVGVQFHPERLLPRHPRWQRLFQALVDAARAGR